MKKADYTRIAQETLTGDLRDFLLEWSKHNHDSLPWDVRPEKKQKEFIEAASNAAETFAKQAIELINTHGCKAIPVAIESIAIKSGVTSQIKVRDSEDVHHFIDLKGCDAYIVLSSFYDFDGQRGDVEIKPDQQDIVGLIEHREDIDGEHV